MVESYQKKEIEWDWLEHLTRLYDDTPVKSSFKKCLRPVKNRRGRLKTT